MAVRFLRGKDVKMVRERQALEDQALSSLRKIVVTHDELNRARGLKRNKAARKFPLIMRKARRLISELNGDQAA